MSLLLATRSRFHPTNVPRSILSEWWSADDPANGAVVTWLGRMNGTAPTQAIGAAQPIRAAASFPGGFPGVAFDGIDDGLRASTFPALPIGAVQGEVWSLSTPSLLVQGTLISYGTGSGTLRRQLTAGSGKMQTSDAAISTNSTTTVAPGDIVVFRSTFETNRITAQTNGDAQTAVNAGPLNTVALRVALGCNIAASPGQFMAGTMRHVMVFATILSDDVAAKMMAWLLWDVNRPDLLPDSHPYKRFRP